MTLLEAFNMSNVVKTMRDNGELYLYKPELGYYIKGETYIDEWLAKAGLKRVSQFNDFKKVLKSTTYCDRSDFGLKEGYLNLKNGVLNIRTKELLPHDSSYCFLNRLEINYNPEATAPMFKQMLESVPEVNLIQKWFAYHLIPNQMHKKAMFMLGKTDSGRSTLLDILEAFLGLNNVTNSQFRDFQDSNTHATVRLYGKLANIHADLGVNILRDVSTFKTLVGNDTISARKHFKEPISFKNHAKLTFAMNKAPALYPDVGNDEAFWNRIILIEFKNSIPKEAQIPNLGASIIAREMSGVLNWALEGYYPAIEGFGELNLTKIKQVWSYSSISSTS